MIQTQILNRSARRVIAFLILSALPAGVFAQKISQYRGKVPLISGDSANVQYEYYESHGQRILQGNYQLVAATSRQQDSLTFEKILWKGAFDKNAKHGNWNYQYQQHRVWVSDINDFNVKTALASEYSLLDAVYKNGKPNGNWSFRRNAFLQGERAAILAESSSRFSNGMLTDAFEFTSHSAEFPVSIQGKFDDRGFLHDAWQLEYTQDSMAVEEIRIYDHGLLLSVLKLGKQKGDTLQWHVFDDVVRKLKAHREGIDSTCAPDTNLHELTFDLGYDSSSTECVVQQTGNAVLQTAVREFLFLDTAFRTRSKLVYGTARFLHPVSEIDAKNISQLKMTLDSITLYLGSVRNRNFLELSNQQSDSLAWGYEFLKGYAERLAKFYDMAEFLASPGFTFVDPAIYFYHRSSLLPARDSISYTYDDETRVKVVHFQHYPVSDVLSFHNRLEEERNIVNQVVGYINEELKTVLQSFQLQKLDSIILGAKAEVDNQYEQISNVAISRFTKPFTRRFLNTEFNHLKRTYTASDNFDEKLAIGYDMLSFLDMLQSFPETLERIFATRDSIAVLYTESRLDPYTFTYVDTKLKRRLYEKAADELFLYMMENIAEETSVEEVERKLSEVENLQKLLIRLRSQNTTLLEKQLKPKTTPEETRKLIGV